MDNKDQVMPACWVVIPAAGSGSRMQADLPKQYMTLGDRTVIEHTLERLGRHPAVLGIVVVLSADDHHWRQLKLDLPVPVYTTVGGAERAQSVLNGLRRLAGFAGPRDWVLVHDAARPCVRRGDIDRLLKELAGHPVGGLLALPAHDTMKRTDADGCIVETVSREFLWRALTPQMFRLGDLTDALVSALHNHQPVTDESSAMEYYGTAPKVVEGHPDNIKITRPADLALAELFLVEAASSRLERQDGASIRTGIFQDQ